MIIERTPEQMRKLSMEIIDFCKLFSVHPRKAMLGFISHPLTNHATICIPDFDPATGKNVPKLVSLTDLNKDEMLEKTFYKRFRKISDPTEILVYINKPFLITIFNLMKDYLTEIEYNELLRHCWVSVEYPHQNGIQELVKLFSKCKWQYIMDKDEIKFIESLSEPVTIYRGTQSDKAPIKGLAWSIDKEKALWFSKRFDLGGKVYTAEIPRGGIYFYTDERGEKEVVINPYKLRNVRELE